MIKLVNTNLDDQFNISITITLTISYGVFHLPHSSTVFVRHFLAIFCDPISYRDRWILDVVQSLFLLISYFSHIFRPLVCLVLDPGIMANLYMKGYKLLGFRKKNFDNIILGEQKEDVN